MFFYKIKEDDTICIYRVYSDLGIIEIPEEIDGRRVAQIDEYCFAPDSPYEIDESQIPDEYHVLAGEFVQKITLPHSIKRIGKNAFYNCRNLKEIECCGQIEEIGGDMFMNCMNLSSIIFRCELEKRTCLKQILSQISWNVEVKFCDGEKVARLYYPELFEGYDEIGPAHIFELNISGEGFRMRQCFHEGVLVFEEYDAIFNKACAEEPINSLINIAADRIVYPYSLADESRKMYVSFIKEHCDEVIEFIFDRNRDMPKEQMMRYIEGLTLAECFGADDLRYMIEKAAAEAMAEISVSISKLKDKLFGTNIKSRYSFEEF